MKGEHPCPRCGKNDWNPVLDVDGPPYDECNNCGYRFTKKDIPHVTPPPPGRMCGSGGIY